MIKFLLKRPIATCMSFIAFVILGIISYHRLPVSILPDIDIPELTIKAVYPKYTAREMESHVARPLRNALQQCTGLKSIDSESSNGKTIIKLRFNFDTDVNLSAIEANEKIDRQFASLPRDLKRPVVIKASATDIPVFFLNMSYADEGVQSTDFLELSRFAQHVIKKRIEQLPEVGLVDVSGIEYPQISIIPDQDKLASYGLSIQQIQSLINSNNFSIGNITVNEGFYQYNIRVASPLRSIVEIQNLLLKAGNNIIKLKDIADISISAQKKNGLFMDGESQAVSLAVIKQADAKMQDLEKSVRVAIDYIRKDYPHLRFEVTQDQSKLLDYSIENLQQTLLFGAILAFVVLFLFIPNIKLPLLMAITVPVSLIISVLFLMLLDISINIISLSGLVLGIGLMIDNSIIVIDNISQFRERGEGILAACAKATNEVIRPLLSSALTTSAVFVPLVFVSGIAGALFFDQAITVTVSLLLSFVVSIILLPVLYSLLIKPGKDKESRSLLNVVKPYEWGFNLIMKGKLLFTFVFLLFLPLSVYLFVSVEKESFPELKQTELLVDIKWNKNISIYENRKRVGKLSAVLDTSAMQFNAWIGIQDYLLNSAYDLKRSESKLYVAFSQVADLEAGQEKIKTAIDEKYPEAELSFSSPDNIFNKTFAKGQSPMVLKLKPKGELVSNDSILNVINRLDALVGQTHGNALGQYTFINLSYDREKLMLYEVSEQTLIATLKTAFNENQIGALNTSNELLPLVVGTKPTELRKLLEISTVRNQHGAEVPMKYFLEIKEEDDFEVVNAGKDGLYVPVHYQATEKSRRDVEKKIASFINANNLPFDLEWTGALYDFDSDLKELILILAISIMLLYFILAVQFESLLQPLIILFEIPIDVSGALLMLMLFGGSLNIMSAIGIVVMTGIIINDSILKIDTINRLFRNEKKPLIDAIHQAGVRRIRPIVMTSLTTMLALSPFLFTNGLGGELQKPLALAVIGGLGLGTLISLYFIPLCYWWIYRNNT